METRLSCIGLKPKVRDVEHILRSTMHNAFMVVVPIGEGASESTVVISNVPQTHMQETSTLNKGMSFNDPFQYSKLVNNEEHYEDDFVTGSRIQQRIDSYISSVNKEQGGVRLVNNALGTSSNLYSDDVVCPQLRFLGIILRSQLVTLLKYKVYDKQVSTQQYDLHMVCSYVSAPVDCIIIW